DGLRLDAVHAICDESHPDLLTELAETAWQTAAQDRFIHLVVENYNNAAHYLCGNPPNRPGCYTAQWNDDIHHAAHVLLTGESDGYHGNYFGGAATHNGPMPGGRVFFQGQASPFRGGRARGEPSRDLPPSRFVSFLQNHDQIGNRALGERITSLADTRKIKVAL